MQKAALRYIGTRSVHSRGLHKLLGWAAFHLVHGSWYSALYYSANYDLSLCHYFFELQKLDHVKFLIPAFQLTRALQFLQRKYLIRFNTSSTITNKMLQRALKIRQSKMKPPGSFETSLFTSRPGVTSQTC